MTIKLAESNRVIIARDINTRRFFREYLWFFKKYKNHPLKGQFHRLGHGKDQNVTAPKKVNLPESIQSVSVGAFHVLCVSHSGKVYGWGDNEKNQIGVDSIDSVTKPVLIIPNNSPQDGAQRQTTVRVAAGPAQSVCWKVEKIPNISWKILENIPKQCSLLENWSAKQICLRSVYKSFEPNFWLHRCW